MSDTTNTALPQTFGLARHLRGADGLAGPVDPGGGDNGSDGELDFSDPEGVARGVAAGVI